MCNPRPQSCEPEFWHFCQKVFRISQRGGDFNVTSIIEGSGGPLTAPACRLASNIAHWMDASQLVEATRYRPPYVI